MKEAIRAISARYGFEPGEGRPVALFLLYYTLIGLFYTFGGAAAETLLLSRWPSRELPGLLPFVYIGIAVVCAFQSWFYDSVLDRLPRIRLMLLGPLALGGITAAFAAALMEFRGVSLLYLFMVIWIESTAAISVMMFYSFAGDHFTSRQARRVFGFINGGMALGTLVAGYSLRLVAHAMATEQILFLAAGSLVLCCLLVPCIGRPPAAGHEPRPEAGPAEERTIPLPVLLRSRYLLLLGFFLVAGVITFRLVEYQFQLTIARSMKDATLAAFLGTFYGTLGIGQFFLQFFAVRWLLRRWGVLASLLLIPVGIALLGGAFLAHPAVLTAAMLNFFRLALAETLYIPGREVLILPLPGRIRIRVQALLSGAVIPLAGGLGGGLILLFNLVFPGGGHAAYAAIFFSLLWLALLLRLKAPYKSALTASLHRTEAPLRTLRDILAQPNGPALLREMLRSPDPARVAEALETALRHPDAVSFPALVPLASSDSEDVAVKAFELLRRKGGGSNDTVFFRGLSDQRAEVRSAAIMAYAALRREKSLDPLKPLLRDVSEECRSAAVVALMRFGGFEGALLAYPRLEEMMADPAPEERVLAVRIISQAKARRYARTLVAMLDDPDGRVAARAADALGEIADPASVPDLTSRLGAWPLRSRIIASLRRLPPAAGAAILRDFRSLPDERDDKIALATVLAAYPSPETARALWEILSAASAPPLLRAQAGRSLRRMPTFAAIPGGAAEAVLSEMAEKLALLVRARREVEKEFPAMATLLGDCCKTLSDAAFAVLAIRYDAGEVRRTERHLRGKDRFDRDNAAEWMDLLLPRGLAARLTPALSAACAHAATPGHRKVLSEEIRRKLLSIDPWLRGIAVWFLGREGKLLPEEVAEMKPEDVEMADLAGMVSYLKETEFFRGMTADCLKTLAAHAEALSFLRLETVFRAGDRAGALYIVCEGEVSLDRKGWETARLGPGSVVGADAILEGTDYLVDCIVREDSRLFRVGAEYFVDLLDLFPEVSRVLLANLSRQLREKTRS